MVRVCPHDSKKKCGKLDFPNACRTCDIRMSSGQRILSKEVETKESVKVIMDYKIREFTCPLCLYTGLISNFYILLKNGKPSEKRFRCPDCSQVMQRGTLFREQTVEEFAEWMLDAMVWKRVVFEKFKDRLMKMGISYQFWEHYKKYKAEKMGTADENEQYSEYVRYNPRTG